MCPLPDLHPYPSMSAACTVARRLTRRGTALRAFRCRCGSHHVMDPEQIPSWARRPVQSTKGAKGSYRNRRARRRPAWTA